VLGAKADRARWWRSRDSVVVLLDVADRSGGPLKVLANEGRVEAGEEVLWRGANLGGGLVGLHGQRRRHVSAGHFDDCLREGVWCRSRGLCKRR
jgi:hypothetical protein